MVFPEEFNSRFAQVLVYGLVITFTYQTSLFISAIGEFWCTSSWNLSVFISENFPFITKFIRPFVRQLANITMFLSLTF
ncbi:hypothetical protein Peur_064803 [Populus x canadensis]